MHTNSEAFLHHNNNFKKLNRKKQKLNSNKKRFSRFCDLKQWRSSRDEIRNSEY